MDLRQHSNQQLQALGQTVYERFFLNYTTKQWGCGPEEIAPEVIARVPVLVDRDNRYFRTSIRRFLRKAIPQFSALLGHPILNCN